MTTAPPKAPPAAADPAAPQQARQTRKFTVAEYYQLAEAGILQHTERVELIEGEIVLMAPIGIRHAGEVDRLTRLFHRYGSDQFITRVQNPVHLGEHCEPEPDLAILRFREDEYFDAHPGPDDILAVIEVSDTTLDYDRKIKSKLYAAAGIPEMLLMNLPEDCLEHLTNPGPDGYAQRVIYRRGDKIRLVSLPDLEFAVDDLLPPRPADTELTQ